MLQVSQGRDPFLKRPLSIFSWDSNSFQFLFRIVGKGTELLRDIREGAELELLGPLGSYYPLPSNNQIPIIVAGGIGIASLFPFIKTLDARAYVFYGARRSDSLLMAEEVRRVSRELFLCTDDGSRGEKGNVVELFKRWLKNDFINASKIVVYCCGPQVMLKEMACFASRNEIVAWLSLEEHMACGVGACLGCVVMGRQGYLRVCKEGPVVSAESLGWLG